MTTNLDAADGEQAHENGARPYAAVVEVAGPMFPLSGGDRYRQLLDDQEERRQRLAFENRYEKRWAADEAEDAPAVVPAPTRQWAVTVFAGLYAEAARNGIKGFYASTCWVVRTAEDRLDKADIDAVPVQLLRSIYLVVSPCQPIQLLWRHRGRAATMPVNRRGLP